MKQLSWLAVPIAVLGSGLAVAVTLLHYVHAHRLGVPGGYFPLGLGAACVGLLAGAGGFLAAPPQWRAIPVAAAITLVVALAASGLLLVTVIWAFGS